MKTLIYALLALACSSSAAQDTWNGADKKMHIGVSFVLGFAAGAQWPDNRLKAFGVAMIPGVLKEVSDRGTTGISGKDLAADALGAALGVYAAGWMVSRSQNGTTVVSYATTF